MLAQSLRDEGAALPAGLISFSPLADLTLRSPRALSLAPRDPLLTPARGASMVSRYAGTRDRGDAALAPLARSFAGLPPMLSQAGSEEMLLDDAERITVSARGAGVPARLQRWTGMWHDWQMFAGFLPQGRQAPDVAGEFVRTCMGSTARQ